MGRTPKYIKYLEFIKPIKEFLKDTPLSDKSLKTYYLALDKFFPFLFNRFKDNHDELKDFDLENYYQLIKEKRYTELTEVKKEFESKDIYNKIFVKDWTPLDSNKKASLLMRWVKETSRLELNGKLENPKNTYLNYLWRIQGFLSKLGFKYEANPKNMEKIKSNSFHLSEDITYEDVIQLYEKMDNIKYKLILKIIMYCGLNPIDVILLRPIDFERYKDTKYYVLVREREKTKHKDTQYLIVFHESFINELKAYFERKIKVHLKKETQKDKIETLKNDNHFKITDDTTNYIKFDGQYNWEKDKSIEIFRDLKPNSIADTFKYHAEKNNLNPKLMPSTIRRLCFTRIEKIFSLADKEIYDLWTQHKASLLTRHYIMSLMSRIIESNYVEKIERAVLIGSVEHYIAEINGYKKGLEKIAELEAKNIELTSDFSEILQGIKPFLAMEYEKTLDDHKVYRDTTKQKAEYEKPEADYQNLKKVMDKIDDFVKKHRKNK